MTDEKRKLAEADLGKWQRDRANAVGDAARGPGVGAEELAAAKRKADRTFVLTWLAVIVITPLLAGALMWLLYRHDLNTFLSGIVVVAPLAVVFAAWQMIKRFILGRRGR